jgi:hypothetical protein
MGGVCRLSWGPPDLESPGDSVKLGTQPGVPCRSPVTLQAGLEGSGAGVESNHPIFLSVCLSVFSEEIQTNVYPCHFCVVSEVNPGLCVALPLCLGLCLLVSLSFVMLQLYTHHCQTATLYRSSEVFVPGSVNRALLLSVSVSSVSLWGQDGPRHVLERFCDLRNIYALVQHPQVSMFHITWIRYIRFHSICVHI